MEEDVYKQHIICIANHKIVFVPILLKICIIQHHTVIDQRGTFVRNATLIRKKGERERISIVSKMNQN